MAARHRNRLGHTGFGPLLGVRKIVLLEVEAGEIQFGLEGQLRVVGGFGQPDRLEIEASCGLELALVGVEHAEVVRRFSGDLGLAELLRAREAGFEV